MPKIRLVIEFDLDEKNFANSKTEEARRVLNVTDWAFKRASIPASFWDGITVVVQDMRGKKAGTVKMEIKE